MLSDWVSGRWVGDTGSRGHPDQKGQKTGEGPPGETTLSWKSRWDPRGRVGQAAGCESREEEGGQAGNADWGLSECKVGRGQAGES